MAWRGNTDSTGNGSGVSLYTLAADITGQGAAAMNSQKIGSLAQADDNGKTYQLITTGGVRSWQILD